MTPPLSPCQRKTIVTVAQCHSQRAVTRLTGHTRRTVARWCRRSLQDPSLPSRWEDLGPREKFQLLKAAPHSTTESLRVVQQRSGVSCSLTTLSRFYRRNNILVRELRLATYKLCSTRRILKVVNIFYSQPRRTLSFAGPVQLVQVCTLPFYAPRCRDGFLYGGMILHLHHPLFRLKIQPHLTPRPGLPYWFLRPRKRSSCWHIVHPDRGDIPRSFCAREFPPEKNITIRAASDGIHPDTICRRCMQRLIAERRTTRR